MVHILVADDEPDVVGIVQLAFQFNRPGYRVQGAYNGQEVLYKLKETVFDLLILDVAMPGPDGFELTERVRKGSQVPIILLTAKALEQDKVRGLEIGADDYVTKPFSHKELIARVDALLRRSSSSVSGPPSENRICYEGLVIETSEHKVWVDQREVDLTPTEYKLLYHLATNRGQVLTQDSLMQRIWGIGYEGESQYLKVYVRRLREKLESNPAQPVYIRTVRGVGYTFPKQTGREKK